jgi:hypothetical protein
MDRQTTFLLALALLVAAGIVVSACGWILLARDRRANREVGPDDGAAAGPPDVSDGGADARDSGTPAAAGPTSAPD